MAIGTGAALLGSAAIGAGAGLLGGGGSDGSSSVAGFAALPRWMKQEYKNNILPEIQNSYAQGPDSFFPGQTFADLTPEQQMGLQNQLGYSQNGMQQQQGQINQSFGNALNAGSLFGDPSVMAGLDTIENRANRNFSENVLPQLRQQATGTGNQYSSKAEQSERLAGRDLQGMISDAQGSFLGGQLGSARSLQGQTIGNAHNINQLGLLPGQTQFNVGQTYQNQNNLGITEDVNRFNFNQGAADQNLNDYLARMGMVTGSGAGSSQQSSGGTSVNPITGALGGAILGGSLYNQFGGGGGGGLNFTSPSPVGNNVGGNIYQNPNGFLTDMSLGS